MDVLSAQEYSAYRAGVVPQSEEFAAGLWSVPVPMPYGSLRYSLSVVHLGGRGAVTIVDPGWASEGALERWDAFLRGRGLSLSDVRSVVVTHGHPDHAGLAVDLRDAVGAQLAWSRREQESMVAPQRGVAERARGWGLPPAELNAVLSSMSRAPEPGVPARADRVLKDGDLVAIGPYEFRALATPGHTPGHLCFVESTHRLLLSGDHILPTVFPGIGLAPDPGEDPVQDFLVSLDAMSEYDTFDVVPGHGYRFRGLRERRLQTDRHVRRRAREVADVLRREGALTAWELAPRLTWSAGWENLRVSVNLPSALMQVELFVRHAARTRPGAGE